MKEVIFPLLSIIQSFHHAHVAVTHREKPNIKTQTFAPNEHSRQEKEKVEFLSVTATYTHCNLKGPWKTNIENKVFTKTACTVQQKSICISCTTLTLIDSLNYKTCYWQASIEAFCLPVSLTMVLCNFSRRSCQKKKSIVQVIPSSNN